MQTKLRHLDFTLKITGRHSRAAVGLVAEAGRRPAERLSTDLGSEMPPQFQEPGQKLYPHRAVMLPKEGVKRKWGNRADGNSNRMGRVSQGKDTGSWNGPTATSGMKGQTRQTRGGGTVKAKP